MNLFPAMEENREEVDNFEDTDSSPDCLRNHIIAWANIEDVFRIGAKLPGGVKTHPFRFRQPAMLA